MPNPIPFRVRGWLYVAGVVVGLFVATVLPDVLIVLAVGDQWVIVATRATGVFAALLAMLARDNLTMPDDTEYTRAA